jgi:hypothetical protein
MKLLSISLVLCLALSIYLAVTASSDEISWVELRADSISVSFPEPDLIEITAWYTIINNMDHDEIIMSDVAFFLDGEEFDAQEIDVTRSLNECRVFTTPADCQGDCYLSTIPPAQIGVCEWIIPQPGDSIPEGCYCCFAAEVRSTIPYSGQDVASFCLDPGNGLWEPSEDNNWQSMLLGPVGTKETSWGGVKAIYKNE